jgi:hypothetical protein
MRIGGVSGAAVGPTTRRAAPEQSQPQDAEIESRALIAVGPAAFVERAIVHTRRPSAPFLAHLIATRMQAPQTRARRRAEPEEATAAYGTMMAPAARRRVLGKLA